MTRIALVLRGGLARALPLAFALALAAAFPGHARAQSFVASENVRASLIAETAQVAPGGTVMIALRQEIREGWHTYWQNPGDSGAATQIAWQLPEGAAASALQFPAPEAIPYGPLVNYGFKTEAVLLSEITLPADLPAGTTARIAAEAEWLVCADICIPEYGSFLLELPVVAQTPLADPAQAMLFARARAALPVTSPFDAQAARSDGEVTIRLAAAGLDSAAIDSARFFPFSEKLIDHAAPQFLRIDPAGLTLTMAASKIAPPAGGPIEGVIVFTEKTGEGETRRALTIAAAPVASLEPASAAALAPRLPLGQALLFALLGGIILNLMPCVLPVLSMKALGLAAHGRESPGAMRASGLAYTAGVLAAFALIAGALIALQAGGASIGWGFQLQEPIFVALLAYVLFALGLMLSGVFTIGGGLMGIGQGLASRGGLSGSFFTGALASVVATPCTAPFMGAALGFAVTQPPMIALGVFLTLGLGLALPYLAICFAPGLVGWLPKPGLWMERLKQILAFPLYASAAWLVWVLSIQAGPNGVAAALAGMVLVAFAAFLYEAGRAASGGWRGVAMASAVLALLGALGVTSFAPRGAAPSATAGGGEGATLAYETYTPARLAALRAEGRPVFLNLTAAWCITCLVNERVAIATREVETAMRENGVVYLKGDWTNRDPAITALLAEFGRNGVPLYVAYPSKDTGGSPRVLPQILTPGEVAAALAAL
jgi:thiol:disulfide interchange protein DsbD